MLWTQTMKIAIIKLPKYTISLVLKTPMSWKETGGTSDSEKSKQESKIYSVGR